MSPLARRTLVLALFALSTGCGGGCDPEPPAKSPAPGTTETPAAQVPTVVPTAVPAVGPPPPPPPGERVQSLQLTQVMVAYRTKRLPDATRSKEEALAFARDLIRQARAGTDFEKLVYAHTDDLGEDGRPFNRGSYSLDPRDRRTQAGLIAAVQATPVGAVAPEPYDSGLAYIVFRRDR